MKPTIPSPVRTQCQVAHRSSSDRAAASERPPRTNASFVPAKNIGYVIITPTDASAAIRDQRRRAGSRQLATRAARVATMLPVPRGIISRPMRCEWDANHAWKALGERLCQRLTKATPITRSEEHTSELQSL